MKTKNTFAFSVYHAIKKNFAVPLIGLIGFLGVLITNFLYISSEITQAKAEALISNQDFREILRKTYKYIFLFSDEFGSAADMFTSLLPFAAVGIAAVTGIVLFRFVSNKKTVNVYYSLGIKRVELYSARYLAGIIMLFVAVAVPLLIMALVNCYFFGSSVIMWKAFLFYLIHFCVATFAAFSIAAAVSGCVGTIVESIGFSVILIAFPSIIMLCVNEAFPYMLFGAPQNLYYDFYSTPYDSIMRSDLTLNGTFLGKILSSANLLMLNNENLFSIGCITDLQNIKHWQFPSLKPYIFWALGIMAFFAFGVFMFKHKKAETCGFMGRNKVLNFITCSIISFIGISGAVSMFRDYITLESGKIISFNMWNRALIGMIISFLVFTVLELVLTRSFKSYKKNLKIVPVHLALMVILIFSLHMGFFGYSSYIPKVEEVKAVHVSIPLTLTGDYNVYHLNSTYSEYYWMKKDYPDEITNCYYVYGHNNDLIDNIDSKDDIQKVINLHQKFIDEGWVYNESDKDRYDYSKRTVATSTTIIYELKDGTTVARNYQRAPIDIYEELFSIEDSERWNKIIETTSPSVISNGKVPVIFSKQMDKKTFIDENLLIDFAQAIAKDIKALDYTSFWRSDAEWLGSIVLYDKPIVEKEYYYDSDTYGYTESVEALEAVTEEIDIEKEISANWKTDRNGVEYTSLISSSQSVIPITSEMKNTIAFLKNNGLYEALNDDSPVVSARVFDACEATAQQTWYNYEPLFNSFWDNGKAKVEVFYDDDGEHYESGHNAGDYMPKESIKVTDAKTIKELENNAYGIYLDTDGGYIVEFTRANGHTTIMFVPNGRISQEIK